MAELKSDQHELNRVGNKVEIKRTTVEVYDAEEYCRTIHNLKAKKDQLKKDIAKDINSIIKDIKAQKKEEMLNFIKVIKGIGSLEKEMQKVRDEEVAKGKAQLKELLEKKKK